MKHTIEHLVGAVLLLKNDLNQSWDFPHTHPNPSTCKDKQKPSIHVHTDHKIIDLIYLCLLPCSAALPACSSWAFHEGRCLCSESALGAPPKNLRKVSSKGQGKTSTQGGTIEHKIHTQMNRIKIPEDTRREGPPFPRIQGTSSSNCHGKILTLERRKGNQQNKKGKQKGATGAGSDWLAASSLYFILSNSLH